MATEFGPTSTLPGTEAGPLSPDRLEDIYAKQAIAKGLGTLGVSAALWQTEIFTGCDQNIPACPHTHAILTCLEGGGESSVFIDGRFRYRRHSVPGSTDILRAGDTPRAVTHSGAGHCLQLYLPDSLLQQSAADDFGLNAQVELLPSDLRLDPAITQLGKLAAQEIRIPSGGSRMMLDSVSLALVVRVLRSWSSLSAPTEMHRSGLAPWQQQRAIEQLQSRYHENLSIADLAVEARLSPFHFIRSFKRSVGIPPHQYLTKIRMERACVLLETTDMAITEVAFETGYQAPAHFARLFRRHYGMTPTAYRRERNT